MTQETKADPAGRLNAESGSQSEIEHIFQAWDHALATKDLEAALVLYADDATIESPLIPSLMGTDEGIVRGKAELRKFIDIVFQRTPASRKHFRTGYFTDGTRLTWEYPRQSPDGEQMDYVEVMEIVDGLIQNHRVYWGWYGHRILKNDEYRR
ncbi:nuclear transport factor 2 family protein [Nocardia jejuensis]|uniref:nuclear transport factor 2 family protein n=1 Tax=Nocardia jejuensis TaxID=328049 RepID=UPI00082BB146|nr:nuclear transport factor 2 family protein [Nocardia jejuensis]